MDAGKLGQNRGRQNSTAHGPLRAWWSTVRKSWKGRKREGAMSTSLVREQKLVFICTQLETTAWHPLLALQPDLRKLIATLSIVCNLKTKDSRTYTNPSTCIIALDFSQKIIKFDNILQVLERRV